MRVEGANVFTVWKKLLEEIYFYGRVANPRDKPIKELLGVQLHINNALHNTITNPLRNMNYRFMVGQWLATLFGIDDKILERFNSKLPNYESDGRGGWYPSYGPRLRPQWPYILKSFVDDAETRQAVMSIWEAQSLPTEQRYVPCTLSLQFLIRPNAGGINQLHTIASMRSSDAWLGLPYDIYNFSMLANYLCSLLRTGYRIPVQPGTLTMNLGSSHLYAEHIDKAKAVIDHPSPELVNYVYSWNIPNAHIPHELELFLKAPSDLKIKYSGTSWDRYLRAMLAPNNAEALKELTIEPRIKTFPG